MFYLRKVRIKKRRRYKTKKLNLFLLIYLQQIKMEFLLVQEELKIK